MPAWAGLPSGNSALTRTFIISSGSGLPRRRRRGQAHADATRPASLPRTRTRDLKSDCSSGSELPVHSHNIVYASRCQPNATRDTLKTVVGAQWSVRIDSVVPSDVSLNGAQWLGVGDDVGVAAPSVCTRMEYRSEAQGSCRRLTRRVSTHDSIMTHRRRDALTIAGTTAATVSTPSATQPADSRAMSSRPAGILS